MGWRFWKKQTEETARSDGTRSDPASAPPVHADTPRMGDFHFDVAPITSDTLQTPALVVRDAAEAPPLRPRRGRGACDLNALGVAPLIPPSLREVALLYREAARQRAANRPDESIELWKAYLELTPEDAGAWIELGQSLLAAHRFESAWGAFVEARQLDPLDPLPAGALGFLSTRTGDHQTAVAHYEDAVKLNPGEARLLIELAEAQSRAGDSAAAEMTRSRVVELTEGAQ